MDRLFIEAQYCPQCFLRPLDEREGFGQYAELCQRHTLLAYALGLQPRRPFA